MDISEESFVAKQLGQGAIVSFTSRPGELFIILSQDCDLVHYSLEDEPYADICKVTLLDNTASRPPNNSFRKTIIDCLGDCAYLVEQKFREHLPREGIYNDDCVVLAKPTVNGHKNLKRWLCARYLRPSFPEAFNQAALRKISKNNLFVKALRKNKE